MDAEISETIKAIILADSSGSETAQVYFSKVPMQFSDGYQYLYS